MANISLNELSPQELVARSAELRRSLFNLRLQQATARLDKPHQIRTMRRQIARCETRISALRSGGVKPA